MDWLSTSSFCTRRRPRCSVLRAWPTRPMSSHALAHHRRRLGCRLSSTGASSGVGLRRPCRQARHEDGQHGIRALPQEGLEIPDVCFCAPPQVGVVLMDVRLWAETLPTGRFSAGIAADVDRATEPKARRAIRRCSARSQTLIDRSACAASRISPCSRLRRCSG
jgi:hypothetical protein